MRSVRAYLLVLVATCILLAAAALAVVIYNANQEGRRQADAQVLETANVLSQAVDRELERSIGLLTALKNSGAADRRDWPALDRQARAALAGSDAWIVVQDRSGRQLVNTRLPAGAALPAGPPPETMWRELNIRSPRICNLSAGLVHRNIVCVDTAIGEPDPQFAITMVFRPEFFESIVRREGVGSGKIATLLDRDQRIIWRNPGGNRFVGRSATGPMLEALKSGSANGVLESTSLEGVRMLSGFQHSSLSGWSVVVGTPIEQVAAVSRLNYWRGLAIVLAILAFGSAIAILIAGRLAKAMNVLSDVLESQGSAEPHRTGIFEIDEVAAALERAAVARTASEDRYRRIFEQSSELIFTADLDQVITDANPAAAEAVGVPVKQLIGRRIADFISPEDYQRTSAMLRQKLAEGGTTQYDVRVKSHLGELLSWEINSGLTFDESGTPVGLHVVGRDVTERKRAERQTEMLVGELNHRVKNTLAVVQSLAHQSFREGSDLVAAKAAFEGRLRAMAAAHNLLTRQLWAFASMTELVELSLAPFSSPGRCSIDGKDFRLSPQAAVSISLAIHELATNAVKYGALSNESGQVRVSWDWTEGVFRFEWRESDGPPVKKPKSEGFGMRLIQRSLAAELGGTVDVLFERDGLICRIYSEDAKLGRLEPSR